MKYLAMAGFCFTLLIASIWLGAYVLSLHDNDWWGIFPTIFTSAFFVFGGLFITMYCIVEHLSMKLSIK